MNQILITEKLYITPELKRQKKLYKIDFIISVFLLCLLFSYYLYSEFDKYSNEKKSKEILSAMAIPEVVQSSYVYDDTTIKVEDNKKIVVILDDEDSNTIIDPDNLDRQNMTGTPSKVNPTKLTTPSGDEYYGVAIVRIPKLDLEYGVADHWTNELLKITPCKFWGGEPNEIGNFCIVGHNYRTSAFFSKVPTLENGDIIELEDNYKRKVQYAVYDKHVVHEKDTRDTTQVTHGKKEVTLITCTDESDKNRYVIRAREI